MQFPKYIYVDDVEQSKGKIEATVSEAMGRSSAAAQGQEVLYRIAVLMDSTHLMRRYFRTCKDGHPLLGTRQYLVSNHQWLACAAKSALAAITHSLTCSLSHSSSLKHVHACGNNSQQPS